MSLSLDLVLLAGGGGLLYFGAEWLVKGAAGLATAFGMRPLVVGLTVVAYGTSAPELSVGIAAAFEGKSAIALGNSVGSNIANLGLILGLTALVSPPRVEAGLIWRELPVLVGTSLMPVLLFYDGLLGRLEAAGLVLGAAVFTVWMLRGAGGRIKTGAAEAALASPQQQPAQPHTSKARLVALAVIGLAVLVAGGKLFVDGAVGLARAAGMSDRVVGLTVVAIGTSLPELAASLVAAMRGHSGIAVGNVVGSNIFNVLLILGAAGLVRPMEATLGAVRLDLAVLVGMTVFGAIALRTERTIRRWEGGLLVVAYAAFLFALGRGVG
jgi:cation:H+ antiporter